MGIRTLFTVFVISMVLLFGMMGCAFLCSPDPSKESGNQPKTSHSKMGKNVAASEQKKRKDLNLKQAQADFELACKKVKLAELKMELSVLEMKLADYHQQIAETMVRKAKIFKQYQKLQADHKAGRVKKAADIDKLKVLKTKSLELESENVKTKAAVAKIDLDIQELKQKLTKN